MERVLIVNADDFGREPAITDGILRGHVEGIVTSTSLMVRWPDAGRAAQLTRAVPALSVGLHLDIGEWRPVSGDWEPVYEVVPSDEPEAMAAEVRSQLALFRELMGRDPTHLDSHQHTHLHDPLRSLTETLARDLAVPLRGLDQRVRHEGGFYGRLRDGEPWPAGIAVENLAAIISGVGPGVTELSCHPGETGVTDPLYDVEREAELSALTDPRIRGVLEREGVELRSFALLRGHRQGDLEAGGT